MPEVSLDIGNQRGKTLGVLQIETQRHGAAGTSCLEFRHQSLGLGLRGVKVHDHACAGTMQSANDRGPHPSRASRDEGDLPLEGKVGRAGCRRGAHGRGL